MKKYIIKTIFFLSIILFTSCRVTLVPTANPEISSLVDRIGDDASEMYAEMRGSTDKEYNTYSSKYDNINSEIDNLISLDNARGKAGEILKQDALIKKYFNVYKNEHMAYGSITNGKINVYDVYIKSYIDARRVSEKSLK